MCKDNSQTWEKEEKLCNISSTTIDLLGNGIKQMCKEVGINKEEDEIKKLLEFNCDNDKKD